MAGETAKSEAVCLAIRPWSRTSHVVTWLTPRGKVATVVRGAVRPKSFFLGQYDLNYTCDVLYYARARGDVHALRDCAPRLRRDALRDDFRALALAGHFRRLASDYAPAGPDCAAWFSLLERSLDSLAASVGEANGSAADGEPSGGGGRRVAMLCRMLRFELDALHLLGLSPEVEAESGAFRLRGEREIPVSPAVAKWLRSPGAEPSDPHTPLDAARAIGVFYRFHLDCAADARRSVMDVILR